jgi:hypothetical protein
VHLFRGAATLKGDFLYLLHIREAIDHALIVNDPERLARGIVEAVAALPITALPSANGAGCGR